MIPAYHVMRRVRAIKIWVGVAGLLALALAPGVSARAQPAVHRNVVLFVADDHGQDTGAYGNPVIQTPHLDRLAAEGTLFSPVVREAVALPDEHGLHGRSFLPILEEENPPGWDEVAASHTFHKIQMYYPMRVVRDRRYKLIWNIAHALPFPFATDLWTSATWQQVYRQGPEAMYGVRTVRDYLQRPAFELYDVAHDPYEAHNLAADPAYADVLAAYKRKLRAFQEKTSDPWVIKWMYE